MRKSENKQEILLEICGIVPLEFKRAYGLRNLRKEDLEALLIRLKQKEQKIEPLDFHTMAKLERQYDLCEKCDHQQNTEYGMRYCNAERRIVSIDPLNGVTFEKLPNPPRYQQLCVTISCNRFLPKLENKVKHFE